MSSISASPSPGLQIDLDHLESFSRGISNLTIDPIKNIFYYVFPCMAAYSSNYIEMRENDVSQQGMMDDPTKRRVFREIQALSQLAGITRTIVPYCALNHQFSSYGGSLSVTKPVLFLPYQHIFRPQHSPFGQEQPGENLAADTWSFSDNEVRFLIAREIGPIKQNNGLLRIAIKIALLVAIYLVYTGPFGWAIGIGLIAGALLLHVISERMFNAKVDVKGALLLGKRINDTEKAHQVAIQTLEKMREQNLIRRKTSKLCKLYITKSGNNILDFNNPFLTTRIGYLQESLRKQQEAARIASEATLPPPILAEA